VKTPLCRRQPFLNGLYGQPVLPEEDFPVRSAVFLSQKKDLPYFLPSCFYSNDVLIPSFPIALVLRERRFLGYLILTP